MCCRVHAEMFYTSRFTRFKISQGCWVEVDGVGEAERDDYRRFSTTDAENREMILKWLS